MNSLRAVLATLTVQVLLLLAVSYMGGFYPLGDSVAMFRLQILAALLIGAGALWGAGAPRMGLIVGLVAALSAAPILFGFSTYSSGQPGEYVLYQKNIYKKQLSRTLLTKEILDIDPDFLTLQEISSHDRRYMKKLFEAYPNQFTCDAGSDYEVGLLSRFPLVEGSEICRPEERLAAARVQMPDGSTPWLVSLHLGWPFPAGQHEQAQVIADWLATLEGAVMVGGDFNMVPWGDSVRTIRKAARANRVGPYLATFPDSGPLLPLPIDHILLPQGATGRAEARPRVGSDHLGLVARFSL